jgi:plasmid stabilization system protein ParE
MPIAEHAHRPGNMESADAHLNTPRQKRLCQIERVWKLIRLHTDKHHHAGARFLDHAGKPFRPDARVCFVRRMDLDLDVLAQNAALFAVARQAIERRERVRRDRRAQPLDHVTFVVIVRRLHQDQTKALGRGRS